MSLSRLLSGIFTGSEPDAESPPTADTTGDGDRSRTVIHECRHCGTNVSAETTRCPACGGDDIVRYSID